MKASQTGQGKRVGRANAIGILAAMMAFHGSSLASELPVVIAHRGASATMPENTRIAIVEALRMGAKVIEFDVRVTSDGELVLFHDDELIRITGQKGSVEKTEWEVFRAMDVGEWFGDGQFRGETPMKLKEAIELCLEHEAIPLIERKSGSAEAFAGVIGEMEAEGAVILQSFDWWFLRDFRLLNTETPIGALGSKSLSKEKQAGLELLQPEWVGWKFSDLSESAFELLQSLGINVALWTVNDPKVAQKWLNRGISAIITDHPDKMLPLIEE